MNPLVNIEASLSEAIKTLCRIFWGPSPQECKKILQPQYFRSFEAISTFLESPNPLEQLKLLIRHYPDSNALFDHLEETYIRLFITGRGGIIAPLYQSCYEFENAPMMGISTEMMKNRLEAIGFRVANSLNEPPDHLCIELEYLYFLIEKGRREKDEAFIKAAASFAADTMLPWTKEFHKKIASEDPDSFYSLAASILSTLLFLIAGITKLRTKGSRKI